MHDHVKTCFIEMFIAVFKELFPEIIHNRKVSYQVTFLIYIFINCGFSFMVYWCQLLCASGELISSMFSILRIPNLLYCIPLQHFKDFVVGHFYHRAHNILVACKEYMDGAQVGCLVKGGVQDVEAGDKSCSKHFKESLSTFMHNLVEAFSKIGADCDKFLSSTVDWSIQ